jgi:hypothetical protein
MSESKLVIPTPKSCRQCKLSFKDRHQGGDVFLTCPYTKIGKTLGESIAVYDKRHPKCPLQPITPIGNVESALEELETSTTMNEQRYKFLLSSIKQELSKIPALEEYKRKYENIKEAQDREDREQFYRDNPIQ